jgi:hypothetical protein
MARRRTTSTNMSASRTAASWGAAFQSIRSTCEGELLAQLIDLAGMKRPPSVGQARQAARLLGSKVDFALGVARMDAIDIHRMSASERSAIDP